MNNLLMQDRTKELSMTSLEIAALVNKRHDNVKRTIETIANTGVIVQPQIEDEPTTDAMGRIRHTQVYVFKGEQGKRDSIVVVAQLSPEFTARLVDRWQELEAKQAIALPDFTNPAAAARAWADEVEAKQQAQEQILLLAPKAAALDKIEASQGSLNARNTAKLLGIKPSKFNSWALAHGWMYRDSQDRLQPHSERIQQGFMELRPVTYKGSDGTDRAATQPVFTPKGLIHLAKIFAIVKEVA